jgi:hypothetical protein
MSTAPNYLAEAIGIADGTENIPVHSEHLRALLKEVPIAHARHFLKGELRCTGCGGGEVAAQVRNLLAECDDGPNRASRRIAFTSFCAECKTDHAV